jgi:hypothetical protein
MHGQGGLMATPGLGRKVAKGSVQQTMHEFKHGTLRSSSGKPVTNRRQALAIALSEAARAKKSISATERKKIPASDFAGPHDSYPIRNQQEVNSAARLAGHAANPDAVRAGIRRIAQRKGLKLPDSWQKKAVTKDVNNAPNLHEVPFTYGENCASCKFAGPLSNGIFCERYTFTTQSFWLCD